MKNEYMKRRKASPDGDSDEFLIASNSDDHDIDDMRPQYVQTSSL